MVALAGYMIYTSDAGSQALSWLGQQFNGLKDTALAAWQGISDALAAGDIGLAARILWLTLKMEFQKGVLWLEEKWIDFKNFFIDTFYRAAVEGELVCMQEAERAERERRKQKALKGTADDLAEAQKEWQDALAEAKRKREAADTARAKVDVQGTFNALGVRGFGSDSLNERTTKAAEQTAANTKRLVQEAQHGGLVFA